MGDIISEVAAAEKPSAADEGLEESLAEDVKSIVDALRRLYDAAYNEYLPLVEEICSRGATEYEVEYMLDQLLDFAGEDRMLALYKQVCRRYFYIYPTMIRDHIYMWRDMYDEDCEE